ncbi:xanthine dehydrogenase, molybdopterin binding subunit [Alcaligenes sp. HPC1271]|nr:xanthine dehydrogenase, molybdopterin binding subunit [Alcaligenes sp. HPC1271]
MKIDNIDHLNTATAQRVGVSFLHESADLHVSGTATYTDDLPELQGTAHIALGLSEKAHARLLDVDLEAVRQAPGVIAVLTVADIPAANNCGPILHDDPILADGVVHYFGQPIFAVIAKSHDQARRAARLGKITYEELPAILTPQEAKAANAGVLP